jgi:pyruvate dehydrogenase E1 component alpha subunit
MLEIPVDLGKLANSESLHEPIALGDMDRSLLVKQLRTMALIRLAEEKIGDEVAAGKIKCPCHLAIGQEAIPVAVSAHLRTSDHVFGTHRSHGHFLAQGGTVAELFAEVLGKVTGCSRGFGGSMHLYKQSTGFWGSVPIVSATVSLAVGAALAAKMRGQGDVGVAYFGDGAMEEGSVHESLNFATVYKTPMLFVVENNLFSSHLHIQLRQKYNSVARYAAANGMAWEVVDGNDPVALHKASQKLVERARSGEGPGFLEAVTYRWRGHVGPREDEDVGVQRKDDLARWKLRDPIRRTLD